MLGPRRRLPPPGSSFSIGVSLGFSFCFRRRILLFRCCQFVACQVVDGVSIRLRRSPICLPSLFRALCGIFLAQRFVLLCCRLVGVGDPSLLGSAQSSSFSVGVLYPFFNVWMLVLGFVCGHLGIFSLLDLHALYLCFLVVL